MKKLQNFWKLATKAWKLKVYNAVITSQVWYGLHYTTWLLKRDWILTKSDGCAGSCTSPLPTTAELLIRRAREETASKVVCITATTSTSALQSHAASGEERSCTYVQMATFDDKPQLTKTKKRERPSSLILGLRSWVYSKRESAGPSERCNKKKIGAESCTRSNFVEVDMHDLLN